MPATPPQDLIDEANCYLCLGMSIHDAMQIVLLRRISESLAMNPVDSFISRAGITDLTEIAAVTTLHAAAVTNGWWDKCDLIYPFVGGTAQAHAQNLKSSNFTITWNGTVTHDANGITGDGATGYGDTTFNPVTAAGVYSLDSAHVSYYRRNAGTNVRAYGGQIDGGSIGNTFIKSFAGSNVQGKTHTNPLGGVVTVATFGLLSSTRRDANFNHILAAGVDTSQAAVSVNMANHSFFVLAQNNNGVSSLFSSVNLAGMTVGSSITLAEFNLMTADWQTFNTTLGRQV